MQRVAVVMFPGSNCDADTLAAAQAAGADAFFVWHRDTDLKQADVVVLPGGFSYGDYLRSGAIARFSPVLAAVAAHARAGGPVLGICNGFQILAEAGLLPGTLLRNAGLRFRCMPAWVRVESSATPFTALIPEGTVLKMPIAHAEGGYFASPEDVAVLEGARRVVFRYCDERGRVGPASNPNGSIGAIAGIASARGNVVGLMPHPERACEALLGSTDGRRIFESVAEFLGARRAGHVVPSAVVGSAVAMPGDAP